MAGFGFSIYPVEAGWFLLWFSPLQAGDVLAAPLWLLVGKGDGMKSAVRRL